MKAPLTASFSILTCLLLPAIIGAQMIDFTLAPSYLLPGKGANQIGPRTPIVDSQFNLVDWSMKAPLLMGQQATECLEHLLPEGGLPAPPYTIETWSLYHVNQAVGMSVMVGDPAAPDWLSAHYGRYQLLHNSEKTDTTRTYRGWKRYWLHQATVVTQDSVHFYQDGTRKLSRPVTLFLVGLTSFPSYIVDEARNARTAWEVYADGEWIVPTFNVSIFWKMSSWEP